MFISDKVAAISQRFVLVLNLNLSLCFIILNCVCFFLCVSGKYFSTIITTNRQELYTYYACDLFYGLVNNIFFFYHYSPRSLLKICACTWRYCCQLFIFTFRYKRFASHQLYRCVRVIWVFILAGDSGKK